MDSTRNSSPVKAVKRMKLENGGHSIKMNDIYEGNVEVLSEAYTKKQAIILDNGAEVITSPFTCYVLPDFIQPNSFLNDLEHELSQLPFEKKMNDLYQFEQSKDLVEDCQLPLLCKFKNLMLGDILEWMKQVTKIPLSDKIDLFCSSYTSTDHLLCHNDDLESRKIAFIFYLVPEWSKEDGGNLDLFNTVNGFPDEVCRTIVPKWNNFVFFEVAPVSFHQVSEILTSKKRIALSGWFHDPMRPAFERPVLEDSYTFRDPCIQEIDLNDWINPVYLDSQTLLDIRETFEENSEISLPNFLQTKKYDEVCQALNDSKILWLKRGPPNWKNFHEANDDSLPTIVKECCDLLTSEAFLLLLSNFTSLSLHPMCDDSSKKAPEVSSSIRKWSTGSYILLVDGQYMQQKSVLNAFMYFNCNDWKPEYNGYCSFVADGEEEELLRIEPTPNMLALVYVMEETSHLIKYLNKNIKERTLPFFHDIFCMYVVESEKTDDVEDNEE